MSNLNAVPRKTLRFLVVAGLSAMLGACGGGGGGGGGSSSNSPPPTSFGNTVPPSSGPGDAENFFPNAVGNAWYYDTVTTPISGPKTVSMDRVLITGQKTVLGQLSSVFQDTMLDYPATPYGTPTEDYYFKNAGGVSYMGSSDPNDPLSVSFAPYIEALFPVAPGTVASFSKNSVAFADLDGDGKIDMANLTLTAQVDDFETLDTALGSLSRTVRATESVSGNATLSSDNSSVPVTASSTTWSASGIGVVKRIVSVTVQGQTQTLEYDIRGYSTDTSAQGLTTPYVIEGNLVGRIPSFEVGQAALGTDGTNFLALEGTPSDVVGSVFDRNGKVLATVHLGASANSPSVSWAGNSYVVALKGVSDSYIHVHRIASEGTDLDAPDGIAVTNLSTQTGNPAIASGSGTSLITFSRYDAGGNQYYMYGVLIDQTGLVISPEFPIANDNSTHLSPQVSFDGTNYLVVWQQLPDPAADQSLAHIYGARVTPAGAVLDSSPIAISTAALGQWSPVVAFDGTNYFVAWQDGRRGQAASFMFDIYGTRVTKAGEVLDASGIAVDAAGTQRRAYPSIAYSGSEYLIAWSDNADGNASPASLGVRLARVSPAGTVTTPAGGLSVSGVPAAQSSTLYGYTSVVVGAKDAAVTFVDSSGAGTLLATLGYGY